MLQFQMIDEKTQYMAKQIIWQGLYERFGWIDSDCNPDLESIYKTYMTSGNIFLIGTFRNLPVATGGLLAEGIDIVRMARISVLKEFRGQGFAKQIIEELERLSEQRNYKKIVLETIIEWESAIDLYKKMGYEEERIEDGQIHLFKELSIS
ncbi:GNAT family N-acetyltransferase [Sutcliffiella halmapala]